MNKFNVGDKVIIVDCGRIYSSYNEMAEYLHAKKWFTGDLPFYIGGKRGIIKNYAIHLDRPEDGYIYLVSLGKREILIGEGGIELI